MANEIPTGGTQAGGGPGKSDQQTPGGSGGTGGYGQDQDGSTSGEQSGYGSGQDLDRGAAYDEQQGGGRSVDDVDGDQSAGDLRDAQQTAEADAFLKSRQEQQDSGPSRSDARSRS